MNTLSSYLSEIKLQTKWPRFCFQANCKMLHSLQRTAGQAFKNCSHSHCRSNLLNFIPDPKVVRNTIIVANANISVGQKIPPIPICTPKGSSNTFKTRKNISLYFKTRHLIIYKYQEHNDLSPDITVHEHSVVCYYETLIVHIILLIGMY